MGREIRRVPKGWQHPLNKTGRYQPMLDSTFPGAVKSHFRDNLSWYLWPPRNLRHIRDWLAGFPRRAFHRPRWRKGKAECYQIYENVTEGTPVSPVFDSLGELIEWLVGEGYSRKTAENFARDGYAFSVVIRGVAMYMDIESAILERKT